MGRFLTRYLADGNFYKWKITEGHFSGIPPWYK